MSSSRRDWSVPAVYAALVFFTASESAMRITVAPYLSEFRGLNSGTIGIVVAAFSAAALLTRLPAGARFSVGRVRALVFTGASLSASAYVLLAMVSHPALSAAALALGGVGWSISTTTLVAALVASRPPSAMGTASAMGWYAGFTALGHTMAGAMGGYLADTIGFRSTFFTLALGPLIGALAITVALHRSQARSGQVKERKRPAVSFTRETLRRVPAAVWAGALVMVFINIIQSITGTFQPLLILAAGLSLTQVGVLSSIRSFSGAVVRLASGAVFARVTAAGLTTPLVLIMAGAVMLMPTFADSFALQAMLFVAIGLGRGLLRVTGAAHAFDAVGGREDHTGLAAAIVQGGLDVGKIIGPIAAGATAQAFGLAAMFRILPAALVAIYLVLRVAERRSQVAVS